LVLLLAFELVVACFAIRSLFQLSLGTFATGNQFGCGNQHICYGKTTQAHGYSRCDIILPNGTLAEIRPLQSSDK
jgi:hypothetical protein